MTHDVCPNVSSLDLTALGNLFPGFVSFALVCIRGMGKWNSQKCNLCKVSNVGEVSWLFQGNKVLNEVKWYFIALLTMDIGAKKTQNRKSLSINQVYTTGPVHQIASVLRLFTRWDQPRRGREVDLASAGSWLYMTFIVLSVVIFVVRCSNSSRPWLSTMRAEVLATLNGMSSTAFSTTAALRTIRAAAFCGSTRTGSSYGVDACSSSFR